MTALPLFLPDAFAVYGVGGEDSSHRYLLTRTWDENRPPLVVCGVNPSTATATTDDATIRRCVRFAKDCDAGGLAMVNLFAFRSVDVRALRTAADPVGAENDAHIVQAARRAGGVVCAWGPPSKLPAPLRNRWRAVVDLLRGEGIGLAVLRLTAAGHPEHPLYLPASCRPELWSPQ